MKRVTCCLVGALALSAAAGDYVADPFRAVDATWPKHEIKGRDYWLMMTPGFLNLKGLENEAFITDSGTAFVTMRAEARRADPWGFPGRNDFYTIGDVVGDAAFKARLKRAPFEVWAPVQLEAGFELTERNFDYAGYDRLADEYGEAFLGVRFNEWDSGILHSLHRYTGGQYLKMVKIMKFPCNRAEMRENFHAYWKAAQARNGKRMFGLSGEANFEHWGCEWGGSVSCVELQSEVPEFPFRNALMFTRSAARQFNVPMCVYTAYFRGPQSPDSRPDRAGPEAGREASLAWREHLLAYYMGNNLQNFESQPYGQVKKVKVKGEGEDGWTHVLTPNGLEMRRLYEWTRSEKGARGECYTPILFLLDRNHGFDQLTGAPMSDGFGPFKGSYAPSDADYFTSYAMGAIAPTYHPLKREPVPDKSANLRNSPLGDIFDVFIANSDVPGRELRDDQLAKYAVVMALGDILWTNGLVNRIRKFVAEGGTFVVTKGQVWDEKFNHGLHELTRIELGEKGANVEKAVVYGFGNGKVVLIENPFMRQEKERWKVPQAMKDLLAKLQDEVVPFRITGDCEFLYNRMSDGSWKAIVMNNAGAAKKGNEPNTPPDPKWTRTATLELPEDATYEEVLEGLKGRVGVGAGRKKLVSFDIPSGAVAVINVRGIRLEKSAVQPSTFNLQPSNFADQAYVPHPVWDKYLKNPEEHRYLDCPGAVLLDWANPTDGREAVTTNATIDAKFYVPMCTFEVEAKASLDPAKAPKGRHEGTLFYAGDLLGAGIDRDGRWYCFVKEGYVNARLDGPKATGGWQKIVVSFDRGLIRFFVDGKEYVDSKRGPLVVPKKDCRDGFYERVIIDVGEAHHGWGNYFPGIVKSLKAVPWAGERFALWPEGKTPDLQPKQTEPFLVWCEPKERKSDMVVIAISGGGYRRCGIGGFEVLPVRDYFLEKGVTVATLLYRTPRPESEGITFNQTAWQDAQRAIRIVRREAKRRGLNPENIGFTGGSAGGNLTMLAAVSSQTPVYAPIDETDKEPCHVNWAVPIYQAYALVGTDTIWGKTDATDFTIPFADYLKFDAKTPPMCLFVGDADGWAPHSVRVWQKLREMKIPVELHVLAKAGHCFQMPSRIKRGTFPETWKDVVWQWLVLMDFAKD